MPSADPQKSAALRIEGEMNIYKAAELKPTLLAAIAAGTTLEIDLSGVTEIDTAGLQLLMLAQRSLQAVEGELLLARPSPAITDIFELLTLGAYFDDPLVIPSRNAAPNSTAR